jgi:photosystem II stability/assembly factor-like uncharacterized protein
MNRRRAVTARRTVLTTVVATVAVAVTPVTAQKWTNVTGNLAYKVSVCGNMALLSAVPDSPRIIAGIAERDLWVNTSDTTWARLSDIGRSERILNRPSAIVYDPANPAIFWESGIYGGPGIYKTTDGGKTFTRLGTITHNDHVSVDFSDPERRTLLASGHEQAQTVYRSSDGGLTWKNVGRALPAGSGHSTHPLALNALDYLVNAAGELKGIYRSADGGESWQRVSSHAAAGPPLLSTSGVIYWAAPDRLLRSTDRGVTWASISVPGVRAIRPVELPGGQLAAIGPSTLIVSADSGASWIPLGETLPYAPDGLIYSPQRQAFFIWRADCREFVPANAVMKLDSDLTGPPAAR